MKSTNVKNNHIHIRVSNSEYDILKNKAKEANLSISSFVRDIALKGKVNHLDNGKDLAQKVGLLHNKIQLYHQDISNQISALQHTLKENNQLLQNTCSLNNFEIANTLKYQNMRINSVLETLMFSYSEKEKKLEAQLHDFIAKGLL